MSTEVASLLSPSRYRFYISRLPDVAPSVFSSEEWPGKPKMITMWKQQRNDLWKKRVITSIHRGLSPHWGCVSLVYKSARKGVPYRAHMEHWGRGGTAPLFISSTPRRHLLPGKVPGTHCGRLGGPQSRLDVEGRGKILHLRRGSNPSSPSP
jgi:hypothetical protein